MFIRCMDCNRIKLGGYVFHLTWRGNCLQEICSGHDQVEGFHQPSHVIHNKRTYSNRNSPLKFALFADCIHVNILPCDDDNASSDDRHYNDLTTGQSQGHIIVISAELSSGRIICSNNNNDILEDLRC